MRTTLNAAIWAATLLCLIVGGLIATILVIMPTSLDPTEMIEGGTEPWWTALYAAMAFVGLVVAAVLGLACWHSARLKPLGVVLTLAQIVAVVWAAGRVYVEYF